MEYTKVIFNIQRAEAYQQDLLVDALAQAGFDTFNELEAGFEAFILTDSYSDDLLKATLEDFDEDMVYTYGVEAVPNENWNKEWEKNFTPMIVKNVCYVRATFHEAQPQYPFEIIIDPKMAFGTGHHQTTTLMMEYILEMDLSSKRVLDMGCGTGILAILAAKNGATELLAIDYDPLSYESTLENAQLNGIQNIEALCGGKEVIPDRTFDVILANINRNILLDQIPRYAEVLASGGSIFYSGFYESDLKMICQACEAEGMQYVEHKVKENWTAAHFIRL